jgi:MFS transporter, PPP family, 3-phenylpropionic acid transporter
MLSWFDRVPQLQGPSQILSPERRLTFFYFTLFATGGVANTYGGIWYKEIGLSSSEIGIINATPIFIVFLLNLVVGRLADRASDWRKAIIIGCSLAAILPIGLFFVSGFWGILLFWSLPFIAQALVNPVADAATMRFTRRRGTDFGYIRAWGTLGYMGAILLTGFLISQFGGIIYLPLFVALALLRGGASQLLPRFREDQDTTAAPTGATKLMQVMKPWFLFPLVGWSMVFATHIILNGFQGLLWKEQGISADVIAILIAVGAVAEAIMFFAFRRVAAKFTARKLILFSCLVAVLRWVAMAYEPGIAALFFLQLLHSLTFALGFLGCMNFIANWTDDSIAAEAQSFFVMIQQIMSVVALTAFGWLSGEWGAKAYLASAVFAALGAIPVYLSIKMQPPKAA